MEKDLLSICSYHEAGHALMSYIVGWNIHSISIIRENEMIIGGTTKYDFGVNESHDFIFLQKRIHCLLGGPVSQAIYEGKAIINFDELGSDGKLIYRLLANLSSVERDRIIQDGINQTYKFLNFTKCKLAIEEIAKVVFTDLILSKETFNEIVKNAQIPIMNIS